MNDTPDRSRLADGLTALAIIESIEDAVRREVMEEAGIKVGQVR